MGRLSLVGLAKSGKPLEGTRVFYVAKEIQNVIQNKKDLLFLALKLERTT